MATISLTFDDGPDPRWTPQLLDVLASLGARATFFPIASRAAEQRDVIARTLDEGHTVGLHGDEHVRHSSRDVDWCRRDTARALALMRSVGARPRLWRTPWGDLAPWSRRVAADYRLRIVGWTVDTQDWRGDAARAIFRSVKSRLTEGAVVLAHDGIGPGARRGSIRETVEFVRLVADFADARGLQLRALR